MKMKIFSTALVGILAASILSVGAAATSDLDNLGGQLPSTAITQAAQPAQPAQSAPNATNQSNAVDNAQAISDAYSQLAPTAEDINAAKEIVSPVVKWVNLGIGIIVALLGTFLLAVTALDLLYIVSPSFIRNIGASASAPQQGGMMGGMMGAPQQQQSRVGGFAGLISDDCKAALAECGDTAQASAQPGMMGGGFGGGMMGGGFGGGMMGGMGAPAAPAKKKTIALCYLKKRAFSLVLIGICIVVLTCTLFLDVGTKLGMWIVQMVSGAV